MTVMIEYSAKLQRRTDAPRSLFRFLVAALHSHPFRLLLLKKLTSLPSMMDSCENDFLMLVQNSCYIKLPCSLTVKV